MQTFVAIIVDGLIYASWLFVVASGLSLIYGVMKILNIAHGGFYALGAYVAISAIGAWFAGGFPPYASYGLLLLSAAVVGIVFGFAMERGILRWMYGRDEILMLLVTYALFLIIEDGIKLTWGPVAQFAFEPYGLLGRLRIGGIAFSIYDLCLIGLAIIVGVALWWGLNRTRTGKLLIAIIHDREISLAMGINVQRLFTVTFIIGAFLGALGGAFTAPTTSVVPSIGVQVIVLAFAVVVIGGLGSIIGAAVGAVVVGLVRAAAIHLFPEAELFVIYAVMSLVLAFRPQGLFGRVAARRI